MATLTLTNLFGNNTTQIAGNSVLTNQGSSEDRYGISVNVTAGHRYYARAYVTTFYTGVGQSSSTHAYFVKNGTNDSVSGYVAEITNAPGSGLTATEKTGHTIFTVPSGVTSITTTAALSVTPNINGAHSATFYLLVDITALENAVGFQYTADAFWSTVLGSTLFATTKSVTYTPATTSLQLFDCDGATIYPIKYIWDNNVTTSYQIKNIWDNDGTTSRLIYTLQSPDSPTLLNYDNQVTSITGGWETNNIGGYAYFQGYNTGNPSGTGWPAGWYFSFSGNNKAGQGWMYTKNKVNLSGWNKIILNFSYAQGYGAATMGTGVVYVALTNDKQYVGGTVGNDGQTNNPVRYLSVYNSASSNTTSITLDISGIDGAYYINIGRYNSTGYATFTTMFHSVTLSE